MSARFPRQRQSRWRNIGDKDQGAGHSLNDHDGFDGRIHSISGPRSIFLELSLGSTIQASLARLVQKSWESHTIMSRPVVLAVPEG